jgi:hypothetical protein
MVISPVFLLSIHALMVISPVFGEITISAWIESQYWWNNHQCMDWVIILVK